MSAKERYFKVAEYEHKTKGPLTEKQYLVHAYLLSISKWNPTETHYYVYKNSFLVKDACELIGITQPTWRNAIKKLIEKNYISYSENKKFYTINFNISWAKLDISLIKYLVEYSHVLAEDFGGIMPSLYGVICRYWRMMECCGSECTVLLSELSNLFFADRTKNHIAGIWTMIQLFSSLELMEIKEIPKVGKNGRDYMIYKIIDVKTKPSEKALKVVNHFKEDFDETLEEMVKNIIDNRNKFEEYFNS